LTAILGYAELLEDDLAGPLSLDQRKFVHQVEKNGKRLERLLNDLLDFARFEAGTFRLNRETYDLVPKLQDVVESLTPQIETAHLQLRLSRPEAPLMVRMDPERLDRVLFNLLSNAIKFTPEGGTIRVTIESRDGMLCGAVSDTGPGIASEDLPRLFHRFSQLELGKRMKGGTGLGLSISKAIIEAHGGQIGASSEPGKGSTFWFQVPNGLPS
jgi:signal transduction histidine kinase